MKDEAPKIIYLKDYKKPPFLIPEIDLHFDLYENSTRVYSRLKIRRNPAASSRSEPLVLNGERLKLIQVKLDGKLLSESEYTVSDSHLTIPGTPDVFNLEIENEIYPHENKALEGLYVSGSIFCTQNEPEGFRKITYFIDRPDVMARYTTTITADRKKYPLLLSNGNPVKHGDAAEEGRHFVTWMDPFPKPSYLFALVAGDLGVCEDVFITASGRKIDLKIYVDKGNEYKCSHAMQSLKRAMKWDEETFGLECDLDIYMIVAVDAFNFGAMENKGLNIFNSQYVLADPTTATDQNYEGIEGVIGHEYFHNWTGNRVTCRDWFQITLKEGLTVFRDQEFSSDMTSRPVKRINDVRTLRDFQFVEDAGPNAHPIRPASYIQVNNFYTVTVYNKGAEVIRMIETLIGPEKFRKGITKYFELYDGKAVTTDDFLYAMEQASGFDLEPLKSWYDQAGTPVCRITEQYDEFSKVYELTVEQLPPRTTRNTASRPFYFPLSIALLDPDGNDLKAAVEGNAAKGTGENQILIISKPRQSFRFRNVAKRPVPSLLRNFSAPVKIEFDYSEEDLAFLLAHDSDPFNRYDAGQKLAEITLNQMISAVQQKKSPVPDESFVEAFGKLLTNESLDPAFVAEAMTLPSMTALTEPMEVCDFEAAFMARETLIKTLARRHQDPLTAIYRKYHVHGKYSADSASVGRRSLKNAALRYLSALDTAETKRLLLTQFETADNMTDEISALELLSHSDSVEKQKALAAFREKWKKDPLVMNKWFAAQAASKAHGTLAAVRKLESDSLFDIRNPNKIRALFGVFGQNLIRFHEASGSGYNYLAEKILEIDSFNPSAAAKLSSVFKKYARLDPKRYEQMLHALNRILSSPKLSRDVYEIISKTLEAGKPA